MQKINVVPFISLLLELYNASKEVKGHWYLTGSLMDVLCQLSSSCGSVLSLSLTVTRWLQLGVCNVASLQLFLLDSAYCFSCLFIDFTVGINSASRCLTVGLTDDEIARLVKYTSDPKE